MREWSNLRRFNALDPAARAIVFYAEDHDSWPHFEPILRQLTDEMDRRICYVTSSRDDPVLQGDHGNIHAFYIGAGALRTAWFLALKADVLVMTMPDLATYHIKRSKAQAVHYVYVFHSIVSTHMVYRREAFDHFDTVLCVGPHHVEEIRAAEEARSLSPKHLVEHGYGRLDTLLCRTAQEQTSRDSKTRVLVAPSWGEHGLLEDHGTELCRILLAAGFDVTVRPHPMTCAKRPKVIQELRKRFRDAKEFKLDTDMAASTSLEQADIMISDYSGAALEYAFAFEKPVLFADVPRKVNNPGYEQLQLEPLEVAIREQIGEIVPPHGLHDLPDRVRSLSNDAEAFRKRIRDARSRTIFNVGCSGAAGAACIADIANQSAPTSASGRKDVVCTG